MILASASPIRAQMLRSAKVAVDVQPARVDEDAIKQAMRAENAPARDVADALAEVKALRISAKTSEELVLGADQVLVADNLLYDKPKDLTEARQHLVALRGTQHRLFSAAVLVRNGAPVWRFVGEARLTMRPFSDTFLDWYLHEMGDEALHSVGCYQLEGLGAQLFSRVEGDYHTILGLPLLEVLAILRQHGVIRE